MRSATYLWALAFTACATGPHPLGATDDTAPVPAQRGARDLAHPREALGRARVTESDARDGTLRDCTGAPLFFWLVERDDAEALAPLLVRTSARDQANDLGETALHRAARGGHLRALERLLAGTPAARAARLVRADKGGRTPLHAAVEGGQPGALARILRTEAAPTLLEATTDAGRTALHLAARLDDREALTALLSAGAAVDHPDKDDATPLGLAIEARATHVLAPLLAAGADPLAGPHPEASPLGLARARHDDPLTLDLLAHVAPGRPALLALWRLAAADSNPAILAGIQARNPGTDPTEALAIAVTNGRADNVDWLLAHGADPLVPDADGALPLHRALLAGQNDIARALLDATTASASAPHGPTFHGVSLAGLARRGHCAHDLVQRLSAPGDPYTLAYLGDIAGLVAALARTPRVLSDHGPEGLGLLHLAAREGDLETVRALVDRGVPIGLRTTALGTDPGDETALMLAIYGGSLPVVTLLVDRTPAADLLRDAERLAKVLKTLPAAIATPLWQLLTGRKILEFKVRIGEDWIHDPFKGDGPPPSLSADRGAWRGIGLPLVERADDLEVLHRTILRSTIDPDADYELAREQLLTQCLERQALPEAARIAADFAALWRGPAEAELRHLADHNHGRILARLGDFAAARVAFDRALDTWPAAQHAIATVQPGTLPGTAPPHPPRPEAGDAPWFAVATILEHRGELALQIGAYADATRDFTTARPLRAFADPRFRNRPASLLALVAIELGHWGEALHLLAAVVDQRQQALGPDAPQTLLAENNLAIVLDALGDATAARQIFERQLAVFDAAEAEAAEPDGPPEPPDPIPYAVAETNVARAKLDAGQPAPALALLTRARARLVKSQPEPHPLLGPVGLERGRALVALGRVDDARDAFETARADLIAAHGAAHGLIARADLRLAELAKSRDPASARALLIEAWSIATRAGTPEEAWPVELALAELEAADDQLAAAIYFGKLAVTTLQILRAEVSDTNPALARSYVAARIPAWRKLADWLVAADRLGEATRVMDLLKDDEAASLAPLTRAKLAPRLTPNPTSPQPPPTPPLAPAEKSADARLAPLSAELASAGASLETVLAKQRTSGLDPAETKRLAALRDRLREGRRAFAQFLDALEAEFATLPPDRIAEIAKMNLREVTSLQGTLADLGHGAVLVHYVMGESKLRIMLTTPAIQVARESAIGGPALRQLIFRFRAALADPTSDPRPLGRLLYDTLVAPIAADLDAAHADTLMFALDGALRYVPIAALYDGTGWFIEQHRLALFSHSAIDKLIIPPRAQNIAALGVAAASEGFGALAEVPAELEGIVKRDATDPDGASPGIVVMDREFSREKLRDILDSRAFSSIHLASHFVFEPGTERDSFLLIGDGDHLSLEDLGLDYRFDGVDLLTLSACNTAVGDDAAGRTHDGRELEGFAALTQRLGARAVIATLWPVADRSTADFMRALYQLRQTAPALGKAEAMREAALRMIRGTDDLAPADLHPRGGFRPLRDPDAPPELPGNPTGPLPGHTHPYYWAPFVLIGNWL